MITTTSTAIIAKMIQVIEGLVPLEKSERRFKESTAPNLPLVTWANDAGAMGLFRLFEVRRDGPRTDGPQINFPTAALAAAPITVTVVYPAIPRLYQLASNRALEALIESDAHQIRDALWAPTALLQGHQANDITIERLAQGERMWFQDLSVSALFYIAQRR